MGKLRAVFPSAELRWNEGLPIAPEIAEKPETSSVDVRRTDWLMGGRGCRGLSYLLTWKGQGKRVGTADLSVGCIPDSVT